MTATTTDESEQLDLSPSLRQVAERLWKEQAKLAGTAMTEPMQRALRDARTRIAEFATSNEQTGRICHDISTALEASTAAAGDLAIVNAALEALGLDPNTPPPTRTEEHTCDVCARTFGSLQGMRSHRSRAHKADPAPTGDEWGGVGERSAHKCRACKIGFARARELAEHNREKH